MRNAIMRESGKSGVSARACTEKVKGGKNESELASRRIYKNERR